jgi:hypothetical protein
MYSMSPISGPHKKRTESARKVAAPLANAVSAKRTVKPTGPVTSTPACEPPVTESAPQNGCISDEDVRRAAYLKWEAAGKPEGDGTNFWLEALQELSQQ